MLILAGVSLNAIIGDNGIITNAQNANLKSGIAVLEEFLQQKYVENYERFSSNENNKTPVEKMIELYSDWFYRNGSNDYILQDYTYKDTNGETKSGLLKIRLIRKKNLPKEIREQLNAGNAIGIDGNEDSDYAYDNLIDVYGVTGDLKVFYCSEGIASYIGTDYASSANIDSFDGTKTIYDSNSNISKILASSEGSASTQEWSIQDLRTIQDLTIDSTSETGKNVTNLTLLADIPNVKKLTLTNYTGSLSGIEKAYKLTYLYFDNSSGNQNVDYTGIEKAYGLTELYFKNPTNIEVENLFTKMSSTDYTKLETLGLFSRITSYTNENRDGTYDNTTFTNITSTNKEHLSLLSSVTKSKIVVLYLGGNSISQADFSQYTALSKLHINNNNFINLPTFKTGAYSILDLGNNNLSTFSFNSGLNIEKIYLDGNNNLTSLANILNHGITWCDARNNSNLSFTDLTDDEAAAMNAIYLLLDSSYAFAFPTERMRIPVTASDGELTRIKNASVIKDLSLCECTNLSDSKIQEVLATLNLRRVLLDGTALSTLSCLSGSDLKGISIRNTSIVNLSPIVDKEISFFRFNNGDDIIEFYNDSEDEEYKTKFKSLFQNMNYRSGGSISGLKDFSGTGSGNGGLCADSAEDLANIIKTCDVTNAFVNYENYNTRGLFDVSSANLSYLYLDRSTAFTKVILPSSIGTINLNRHGCPIECWGRNITQVSVSTDGNLDIKFMYEEGEDKEEVDIEVGTLIIRGQTMDSSWADVKINTLQLNGFSYGENRYGTDYREDASHFYKNMTLDCIKSSNLTSDISILKISNVLYTSLSELDKFATLTELRSWCNNLTSLGDYLTKNTTITGLYLTKNKLLCLDGLESGTNLQTLDLSNNLLENQFTSKVSGENINTSTLIASLPALTYVDLSGNSELTDFQALYDAGFTNNGKNVFTRTLGGN